MLHSHSRQCSSWKENFVSFAGASSQVPKYRCSFRACVLYGFALLGMPNGRYGGSSGPRAAVRWAGCGQKTDRGAVSRGWSAQICDGHLRIRGRLASCSLVAQWARQIDRGADVHELDVCDASYHADAASHPHSPNPED
eukprot:3355423-Amphidinium_carterae.1